MAAVVQKDVVEEKLGDVRRGRIQYEKRTRVKVPFMTCLYLGKE